MHRHFYYIFLLFATPAFAQLEGADAHNNMQAMGSGSMMSRSFDSRFKGVAGTPYLFGNYTFGGVTMKSGKEFTFDSLNFDAYTNDLVVKRDNSPTEVNKAVVRRFWLLRHRTDTMKFELLPSKTLPKGEFFVVLVNDSVSLYHQPLKTWNPPNNTGAYSTGRTYSQFEYEEKFYFRDGRSGELVLIKNKKAVLAQFPAIQSKLEAFVKNYNTSFKNEEDLKSLFIYINQLADKG